MIPADDRRARILRAALRELTARGFEAASTNAIAEAAGVAKGLVFHHFGDKEGLFVAVFEAVVGQTVESMSGGDDPAPADLFERLHAWSLRKVRAFQRDPLSYQLIAMATADAPPGVRARIEQRKAELMAKHAPRLLEGIDASRLRPGVTVQQALETLTLLAEGLERRLMPQLASLPDRGASRLEEISRSWWEHFARLRDGLYRPTPPASG